MKYIIAASFAMALQGVGAALWHKGTVMSHCSLIIGLTRWGAGRRGGTDHDSDKACPNDTTCYKITDSKSQNIKFWFGV